MNQPTRVEEPEILNEAARADRIVQNYTLMQMSAEARGVSETIESATRTGKNYLDGQDGNVADERTGDHWYIFITIGQKALDIYTAEVELAQKHLNDKLYNFIGLVVCNANHPEQPFQYALPSRSHRQIVFRRALEP